MFLRWVRWALVLLLPCQAAATSLFDATPSRLPKSAKPLAYTVRIAPDWGALAQAAGARAVDFEGRVEIAVEVLQPTDTLTLHANALQFRTVTINGQSARADLNPERQTATISGGSQLAPGRHVLEISYAGKINAEPNGFYYLVYETGEGPRRMLSTQLQPSYARSMFPCWDEPIFKATFDLSIVTPTDLRAVSNMPVVSEVALASERKVTTFATTPVMSSYLVVLAAGELETLRRSIEGVDVGVIAPRGRAAEGAYALDEVVARVLPYYNEYFGVRYPLPKLDHIAIPGAIERFEAMENWGGITYVDYRLLLRSDQASVAAREAIFTMIAHETAHQWFGNYVTMAWWDDIWLNEGFASWMERKVAEHFQPSWNVWVQADVSKERAMQSDAMRTSHPLQQPIADESEAESAFDEITYHKGEAFVRMLEGYLGEEVFRDGLRLYMRRHAFGSATTADLWHALSSASGQRIDEIAAGFVHQPGVPLIRVAAACEGNTTVITLTQERYAVRPRETAPPIWQVPVRLGRPGQNEPARAVLVGGQPERVQLEGCGRPVKANFGNTGYYRVAYERESFDLLRAAYPQLAVADRANLLADAWAMVAAGRAEPKLYLQLATALGREDDVIIWQSVADTLLQIDRLLRGAASREAFRRAAHDIFRPLARRLGWQAQQDEPAEHRRLRALAITTLGCLGERSIVEEARRRFRSLHAAAGQPDHELVAALSRVVGCTADRAHFAALLRAAKRPPAGQDPASFVNALSAVARPEFAPELIGFALEEGQLSRTQIGEFVTALARNTENPALVWRLVLERRRELFAKGTATDRLTLLPQVARLSADPDVAAALMMTDEAQASRGARYEAEKAAEHIAHAVELRPRLVAGISAWLRESGPR